MIRRLIARLQVVVYAATLRRWRRWQQEKFCDRLREEDIL